MAEPGSRTPAGYSTALDNIEKIQQENLSNDPQPAIDVTRNLRDELQQKGLRGFKKGGKVKKTGPALLHKGEVVLTAKQAKAASARSGSPDYHPNLKAANIGGYEPRHSSKHR